MIETLALLFPDGSLLVLPEGTTVEQAQREAEEFDSEEPETRTRVVRVKIRDVT